MLSKISMTGSYCGKHLAHALFVSQTLLVSGISKAQTDMLLYEGEVKVMRVGDVDRVALGNSSIASTSVVSNGQLIVIGEKEGITSMHIWHKDGKESDYKVVVTKGDSGGNSTDIADLISSVPGVKVRTISGKSIIEGVVNPDQKKVLKMLTKEYPGVIDMTQESIVAGGSRMVLLNVKFTEFKTNKLEKLGIAWQTDINGPSAGYANVNPSSVSTSDTSGLTDVFAGAPLNPLEANPPLGYFGILTEIPSRLNFLASSGDAIILAEPRLSARSGGSAEFVAGGEVPIPIQTEDGITIEYKKYGIILNISPIADENGNVQARVETEVSTIDNSVTVNGAPGFLTRKTSTDISLRDEQTLVISGLVDHNVSESLDKVKFLGDLPILGPLFRSKTFTAKKSELVIFVTPKIYDAQSEENQRSIKLADELRERFKSAIKDDNILD